MDLLVPDFSDYRDPSFSDSRDPMIIFADSRNQNRVPRKFMIFYDSFGTLLTQS